MITRAWLLLAGLGVADASAQSVHFVDQDAGGSNNGASWSDAFTSLQNALSIAGPGDQIWVAAGVYQPDIGSSQLAGDRTASFALLNGVEIYGGFDGTESLLAERAGLFDQTILSGDLDGDDGPDFANNAENSYHVTLGSGTDPTAVLDGFTISGGHADGIGDDELGAGMLNDSGDPTVRSCLFVGNDANAGGGMFNQSSSPNILSCDFIQNRAVGVTGSASGAAGGGIFNRAGSAPVITDCVFEGNEAQVVFGAGAGAGMVNCGSSPSLVRCSFRLNTGRFGGAVFNENGGAPVFLNCDFLDNVSAEFPGGVAYSRLSSEPTFANCVMARNTAFGSEGAALLHVLGAELTVVNCTIYDNGGTSTGSGIGGNATAIVSNSILWANGSGAEADQIAGPVILNYSCVEGLTGALGGIGNIGADPLLADPDNCDDFRLLAGSPCLDAGDNNALLADDLDLDGDLDTTEPTPFDISGSPRLLDDPLTIDTGVGTAPIVDIGSHENDGTLLSPEPWADLGSGLAGALGVPVLSGDGGLCADSTVTLSLSNALPNTLGTLVIGFSVLNVPLKQGVLVPEPLLIIGGLPTGPTGSLDLNATWPSGLPSSLTTYYQYWIVDGTAPKGLSASNGLSGTTP